jgi:hypothetical protein
MMRAEGLETCRVLDGVASVDSPEVSVRVRDLRAMEPGNLQRLCGTPGPDLAKRDLNPRIPARVMTISVRVRRGGEGGCWTG